MQAYSPSRDGINRRRVKHPDMSKSLRHGARQEAKALVRLELSPLWDAADDRQNAAIAAKWIGGPDEWAGYAGENLHEGWEAAWSCAFSAAQNFPRITALAVMKAAGWAV